MKKFVVLLILLSITIVGVVYTSVKLSSRAAVACMTAQQVLASNYCYMLFSNQVYNHRGDKKPNGHQGHPCQVTTTATSGTVYDATSDINGAIYNFHVTLGYLITGNGNGGADPNTPAPLCPTVTVTAQTNHLVLIKDPVVTPTPTPTPAPIPGDLNLDHKVDVTDFRQFLIQNLILNNLSLIVSHYGQK